MINRFPLATKVIFPIGREDGSTDVESIWAEILGDDQYKLHHSPFFAFSISCADIVYARFSEKEEYPLFERVLIKSGNRTMHVVFDLPYEEGNRTESMVKKLRDQGCSFGFRNMHYSVNIPASVDLSAVCAYLTEQGVKWELADPN